MASFFRRRIAQKVLSVLKQKQGLEIPTSVNVISSLVTVYRFKSPEPQLILPWKRFEHICDQSVLLSPNDLLRILRNQGLPTAEGFINIELSQSPLSLVFTIDKHIFSKIVLLDICNNEDNLAKSSCLFEGIKKKNIVVQCGVPQLGEPLHLTHFRSLIHGNFVANINRFAGHNVVKVAHVNDWGLDAASFLSGFKKFYSGQMPQKKNSFLHREIWKAALLEYQKDYSFKEIVDSCYVKMERGDADVISDWKNVQQLCTNYYDSIYKKIGVSFDDVFYDSSYHKKSREISSDLVNNNVISNKDGYLKFESCEELNNNSYAKNIANINSALYDLSRHICSAVEIKKKYNFDAMYYVVPSSVNDFLTTVFYLINKLNYPWSDELHQVSLNLISNFETKRRKREGVEIMLDQLKDSMILKMHENLQMDLNESLEEMAACLSMSSLIVNDFKQKRSVDYCFDWQSVTSLGKDTGASFQLCYAGLKRLQEDSEYRITDNTDTSALLESKAHHLIQHLARFDEMVFKSYMNLEPYFIVQYLSSLWYFTDEVTNVLKLDIRQDKLRVIKARLLLLSATLKIFEKGIHLLGLNPLEKVYLPEKALVVNNL